MKVLVIPSIGPTRVEDVEADDLRWFQTTVGGYIEIVRVDGGGLMVMNEDGKRDGLIPNVLATNLYPLDIIVGDVVIVGTEDEDGEFTAAPAALIARIQTMETSPTDWKEYAKNYLARERNDE